MNDGKFSLKLKFEGIKIVDNDFNNFEEVEKMFKDVKKKFKGAK